MTLIPSAVLDYPGTTSSPSVSGYINSVQHVSVAIPTSTTTGSTSISGVGSLAFMVFDGNIATVASNTIYGYCRMELTNSSTVTAYRNTQSPLHSISAQCCVIDATSNLVNSVQSGIVTIASGATSGTTTISSVSSSNSVLVYLGNLSSQATVAFNSADMRLSYSGTTITATRNSSAATTCVANFMMVEFQAAALAQPVQNIQKSWTSTGLSTTQTISSVSTANSVMFYAGQTCSATTNGAQGRQYAQLTNSSTITYAITTSASIALNYNSFVVEFVSGVLVSNVQRGLTTLSGATSTTTSISSVTKSKSMINWLGNATNQTSANLASSMGMNNLTNGTTVSINKSSSTGGISSAWEVAEFN